MKKYALPALAGILLSIQGASAVGKMQVYTEEATWTRKGTQLSATDQRGIELSAIERAVGACREGGSPYCVVKSSRVIEFNTRAYKYPSYEYKGTTEVTVHGFDTQPEGDKKVFKNSSVITTAEESADGLLCLAARKSALDHALAACHKTYQFCGFLKTDLESSAVKSWDKDYGAYRYATTGSASVIGFNLVQGEI